MQVGAFADGPELDDNGVPTTGTASYSGRAGGMVVFETGGDNSTTLVGEYSAENCLECRFWKQIHFRRDQ